MPAITGALKTSSFRLNRKERINKKTGEIAKTGSTMLAGAILRAVYLSRLETLTNRPLKMKSPIVPVFILLMASLRSRFTKDKPKITIAAVQEIKAPTAGEVWPLSPIFIRIGVIPVHKPALIPKRNNLRGMPENRP